MRGLAKAVLVEAYVRNVGLVAPLFSKPMCVDHFDLRIFFVPVTLDGLW